MPSGGRLVDEKVARVRLGIGIPGEHLDASRARLAQHRRNARAVLDRHGDRVHLPRDPALDKLVLPRRVETGRPVPDELDAELARGFFGANAAAHEVRVALRLRHHRDDGPTAPGQRLRTAAVDRRR